MKTLTKLLSGYMQTAPTGRVEWIGVRPERKAPMVELTQTVAIEERGLKGDRTALKSSGSGRQVTLISAEDIKALASTLGREAIDPTILRRNIVVSGINLHAMRYQKIRIGEAILEVGAHCHPCSRMESALGKGGFLAMYMRGGYCCKVTHSGLISIGDSITHCTDDHNASNQQGHLF